MPTELQLREDFAKVTDKFGFITPDGSVSGNGIRYTSEYLMILEKLGFQLVADRRKFWDLINLCEAESGCVNRNPDNKDGQGPDDYCALVAADIDCAVEVYGHGLKTGWIYCNPEPGVRYNWTWEVLRRYVLGKTDRTHRLSALFFRQPQLIAHFMYSALRVPSLWRRLWWTASVWHTAFSETKHQDEWVLSQHLITSYLKQSHMTWYQNWVCKYWEKQFKKTWVGGFKELLTKYFGFEHPLARYWVDNKN